MAVSTAFPDLRPDWPLLRDALAALGVAASTQIWTDPGVRWEEFALVVANGAWDNIHRPDDFLVWAEGVAGLTRLVNAPAVLRWNMDKRYLTALAAAGVPTVATTWVSPTATPSPSARGTVPDFPPGEFVVKPTVSGGGFETARYRSEEADAALSHIDRLLAAGRTVMIQPYQAAVDTHGETGLIFLGGQFSHAIAKGPLLRPGAGTHDHLWEHEEIGAAIPTAAQLATARSALGAAERLHGPTTYARVDLVSGVDGSPAVLELELLDPALYFETEPAAASRFAHVLRQLIG